MRSNWLSNRVFDTYEAIIDAACEAWGKLLAQPETITRSECEIGHMSVDHHDRWYYIDQARTFFGTVLITVPQESWTSVDFSASDDCISTQASPVRSLSRGPAPRLRQELAPM